MNLSTLRYLEPGPPPPADELSSTEAKAWTEVTKGLVSVLCGYVLAGLNAAAGLVIVWVATEGLKTPLAKVTGGPFSVLLVGGAVLFFSSLGSSYLIVRGKWRCVANAPEERSARWLVFASMICLFAGPAVGLASDLAGGTEQVRPDPKEEQRLTPSKRLVRSFQELRGSGARAVMRLAGSVTAALGPVFFVLFLRAVARCLGSAVGARGAELYLLYVALLLAASVALLLDPRVRIQVDLLLCLGAGWLMAALWYFLLIVGAVFRISAHVNATRTPFAF